jgi:hypothetical protein
MPLHVRSMFGVRTILMVIGLTAWANHAMYAQPTIGGGVSARTRCVTFATPNRLSAGESFRKPIGKGLEVRIRWDGRSAWIVTAGPVGSPDDYLWVVSPPWQTAPHLVIGEGYGVTVRQSAQFSPRRFRFVTTATEYGRARDLVDAAQRDAAGRITVADIERQGQGTLELWITDFGSSPTGDALTWIRLRGRACQPR